MRVSQVVLTPAGPQAADFQSLNALAPQLVLAFGSIAVLRQHAAALRQGFPQVHLCGCSTAGEISNAGVGDNSLVLTAVRFEATRVAQVSTEFHGMDDSRAAGQRLALGLERQGLRAVFIIGQGAHINGSAFIAGVTEVVGAGVSITGGLAGDAGAFAQTWVLDDQGVSTTRMVCLGLYGEALRYVHGSFGGWSPFGPARKVTRCVHNVLYELDGESALAVYKRYLGEHAKGLPTSGLLFPFSMLGQDHHELGVIRTIQSVNEADGSLTLAGDIDPEGYLKLMHASTDALVGGAEAAAELVRNTAPSVGDTLAVLVSCVGRKLAMGGRVDEEVEAVASVLGADVVLAGFYSNGELSPSGESPECKLHNQTMTITCLSETV